MLNALVDVKGLARTSQTPGRTQSLNFFTIGATLALVDLPGYGYAKIPERIARDIALLMTRYLGERENLAALVLLVDARRGPEAEEEELAALARDRKLEVIVAATKCDKLKRAERNSALARLNRLVSGAILCSAKSGEGIKLLRRRIDEVAPARRREAPGEQSRQ